MATFETGPCPACEKPIIEALTKNGRRLPVDPEPARGGNVALADRTHLQRPPLATVLAAAKRFGRRDLHESHFVTCPRSTMWRSR
jgi:hypothetical protein